MPVGEALYILMVEKSISVDERKLVRHGCRARSGRLFARTWPPAPAGRPESEVSAYGGLPAQALQ